MDSAIHLLNNWDQRTAHGGGGGGGGLGGTAIYGLYGYVPL